MQHNVTVGSLFSGYGGLELGIQQVYPNAQVAWQSEIDKGCQRLLKQHYPNTPNLGDITKIDWHAVPRADIICGGSPCQDMSLAGLRAGMKQGTRSGLWEYMRQAVEVLQPAMVVWENVRGALSAPATSNSSMESASGLVGDSSDQPVNRAVGRVLGDLTNLGYNACWSGLRASDVGACHHRYRIFLVAVKQGSDMFADSVSSMLPATGASGSYTLPTPTSRDYKDVLGAAKHRTADTDTLSRALSKMLPTPDAHMGEQGSMSPAETKKRGHALHINSVAEHTLKSGDFGEYTQAIHRHEQLTRRPAPAPVAKSKTGSMRLNPNFVEWMMCLPENWVCHQGLSRRQELQALGNGVVPVQAATGISIALRTLHKYIEK